MSNFYPLFFDPQYKYRVWGGQKLSSSLGRLVEGDKLGESWEISTLQGYVSKVSNGAFQGRLFSDLINEYPEEILGRKIIKQFGPIFPLLIKFIDAKEPLSVQVHPNDNLAQKRHKSFGKNEMWYVLDADPNAELIVGFDRELDQNTYSNLLLQNRLDEVLHREKVTAGSAVYIPTGTIHAIGAGILLAEIQQSSNITYRVYDYDRVDSLTGNKRELHNELALDAIDFYAKSDHVLEYNRNPNQTNSMIQTPDFTTDYVPVSGCFKRDYVSGDAFKIFIFVGGALEIKTGGYEFSLVHGQTLLIPAIIDHVEISGEGAYLEVSI